MSTFDLSANAHPNLKKPKAPMIEGGMVSSGNTCCDSCCGCCLPNVTGLGPSATPVTDKHDLIYKFFKEGARFTCQEYNSNGGFSNWPDIVIKDGNFKWEAIRIELQFWKDANGGYMVDAWGAKLTEFNPQLGSFRLTSATASTLNGKFTRRDWSGAPTHEIMVR